MRPQPENLFTEVYKNVHKLHTLLAGPATAESLHSEPLTWRRNPPGRCGEANATQHYLSRGPTSADRKIVYTLSKMISFPSLRTNTMNIQPYVCCNHRFSELGLISPYDIIHLGVTMDIGALVDNASNAASFRRALMTPLKSQKYQGQGRHCISDP